MLTYSSTCSDDGNFEVVPPPDPDSLLKPINIADAIADSVELVASRKIADPEAENIQ